MQLRTIQDWVVRRQLLGTEGVADVASFGGDLKQYEVAINPAQLKSMGVTMTEVFDALSKTIKIQVVLTSKKDQAFSSLEPKV
jgi:cobalt-zinc-cadmium resistance protein CzcA